TFYASRTKSRSAILNFSINSNVPNVLSAFGLSGTPQGMALVGSNLYTAIGYGNGFDIVDVTNSSSPIFKMSQIISGNTHDVVINGNQAYFASDWALTVIQLVSP